MPRFKEQAVCIRHVDWSETSQVVVLLTEHRGKLRGLAKGSKRNSPSALARFSGGIELLTLGQVCGTTRGDALATLTEWDLQDDCHHLRTDLAAHRAAMIAADLTHAFLADEDPHPVTFAALRGFLRDTATTPANVALLRFQWALLTDAGFRPDLDRDVLADADLADAPTYTFDPQAGGLTTQQGVADWRVRRATVELLRAVADDPTHTPRDSAAVDRANRLLQAYARHLLGKQLPTMPGGSGRVAK